MILVFAHADPSTVRERYTGLLPAGTTLRPFVLPGGSSAAYEQHARALRASRRSVAAGLRATYAPERPADEPLVLVTFSAGYGLARELLRDTDPGIAGLVLLDSLHASTEGDGTPLDSQMAPFVTYAKRAQRGEVAMWVGHSDVPTHGYESTTETAAELVRLAGAHSGLFHVQAFNVRDAAHAKEEHMAALREWGPEIVAACVSALTGEAVPSTQPRPTPVTHGAPSAPPVLRRGDKGESVRAWQIELGRAGFRTDVDSDFGPRTEAATKRLQMAARITQDGVVGPATRAAAKRLAGDTEPVPAFSPSLRSLSWPERDALFGRFDYVANADGSIRILGSWVRDNIVEIVVPQLIAVEGGPRSGRILMHRKAAEQTRALFDAWERERLMHLVLSWAGSWVPRMVRGSTTTLSNHAFGTAFDINAAWNGLGREPAPLGATGSVLELLPLAEEHGFAWGGTFSRKDGMHFEVARAL